MRKFIRASLASVIAVATLVGPVSAATRGPVTVAQAQQAQGTLNGRVVDARGGGLGGATVTATGGPGTFTATTDGAGRFTFSLAPGVYTLVVSKGGYQQAQSDDVAIAGGTATTVSLTLQEVSLSSLRVIGRTSATANRNPLNIDSAAVTTISSQVIQDRPQPNLNELAGDLPGVFTNRDTTGRTPNSGFIIRGSAVETKVNINGHGVSSGVFGTWNSNYTNAEVFDQIEVVKGAALVGANAGESAVGTINLRTRSIVPGNHGSLRVGTDSYGGSIYSAVANVNLLKDRLGIVAVKTFSGYRGTTDNYIANRIGVTNVPAALQNPNGTGTGNALIAWQGDLSNRYTTQAELVKARYKLSEATWITGEFLGSHGKYQPQGGSYAIYDGTYAIPQCWTTNGANSTPVAPVAAGAAGCTASSIYNTPSAIGAIGQTNVPMYDWFPNSELAYNEPQFDVELRTTFKNDTLFLRPYSALINRFINGQYENYQPGYGSGSWFAVTNPANCIIPYTVTGGVATLNQGLGTPNAKGPCYTPGQGQIGSTPYVAPGGSPVPLLFPTQSTNAPSCAFVNGLPTCYTTGLNQQANGQIGFSTPFSQPEVDRLHGVTFQYLHPVKDNMFTFSFDYQSDDTLKYSNDTTPPPPGCAPVIGSGVANAGVNAQAACSINGVPLINIPQTGLQIPPTKTYKYDYGLTGQFQLRPELSVGLGAYVTSQRINSLVVNPTVLTAAAQGNGISTILANTSLIAFNRSQAHFDPHLVAQFRPSRDVSWRFSAGSGTTLPYAGILAGFPRSSGVSGSNVFNISNPNPNAQPETTVAYDLGADLRQKDGGVFSFDVFNNTTHNVFLSVTTPIAPIPNTPNATYCSATVTSCTTFTQSITANGPIQRNYGLELTSKKNPLLGFGYNATVTLERSYYDQLPLSYYGFVNTAGVFIPSFKGGINGKQLDGTTNNSAIPFAKGRFEGNWSGPNGTFLGIGASYFGSNNSYRDTAVTIYNAVARTNVGRYKAQMSIENLFNLSTGNFQGSVVNAYGPTPTGAEVLPNGQTVYSGAFGTTTRPNSVQIIPPRDVRFILSRSW